MKKPFSLDKVKVKTNPRWCWGFLKCTRPKCKIHPKFALQSLGPHSKELDLCRAPEEWGLKKPWHPETWQVFTYVSSPWSLVSSALAWPPLQSLAVKKNFYLCKFWAVKNFENFLKRAGEMFLNGLRGAKNVSNAFRIVFRILFRVFQTVFRIDLKVFRGQFRSADMPPELAHPSVTFKVSF